MNWADRVLSRVDPLASEPQYTFEATYDAYKAVMEKYGESDRAWIGMGNSLLGLGKYRDAQNAFSHVSDIEHSRLVQRARDYRRIADRAAQLGKGEPVIVVIPFPDHSDRWIALYGKRFGYASDDGKPVMTAAYEMKVGFAILKEDASHQVRQMGKSFLLQDTVAIPSVKFVSLDSKGTLGLVNQHRIFGVSSSVNCQAIFRVDKKGVVPLARFDSSYESRFAPATRTRGWRICGTAVYKTLWEDVYEYRNGRFQCANATSPDLIARPDNPVKKAPYFDCQCNGVRSLVHRDPRKALKWLKLALQVATSSSDRYIEPPWGGPSQEEIRFIRKQIQWVSRGELAHHELYQPLHAIKWRYMSKLTY